MQPCDDHPVDRRARTRRPACLVAGLLVAILLVGCGGGDGAAVPADPVPGAEPERTSEPASDPTDAVESAYRLVGAAGQPLPVAQSQHGDCERYLASGMVILEDGRFELRHTSEDRCPGRPPREATHRARGNASLRGGELRLDALEGTAFDVARGGFRDGKLWLDVVESAGAERRVDWAYDRVPVRR